LRFAQPANSAVARLKTCEPVCGFSDRATKCDSLAKKVKAAELIWHRVGALKPGEPLRIT